MTHYDLDKIIKKTKECTLTLKYNKAIKIILRFIWRWYEKFIEKKYSPENILKYVDLH